MYQFASSINTSRTGSTVIPVVVHVVVLAKDFLISPISGLC